MAIGTTRTVEACEKLRVDILDSRHAPGSRLRIDHLSTELGVSPGAIRESLSRLTAEGLVMAEPNKGFVVAPVSAEELRDLTEVRIEIEVRCLRRSIERGDLAWESRVLATWHQLSRTPERVGGPMWRKLHNTFHDALVSACESHWRLHLRAQLFMLVERYRRMTVHYSRDHRSIEDEHRAIAEATLARDADLACVLLQSHLQKTTDTLLALHPMFGTEKKKPRGSSVGTDTSEARATREVLASD